jgi:hypothetical protein
MWYRNFIISQIKSNGLIEPLPTEDNPSEPISIPPPPKSWPFSLPAPYETPNILDPIGSDINIPTIKEKIKKLKSIVEEKIDPKLKENFIKELDNLDNGIRIDNSNNSYFFTNTRNENLNTQNDVLTAKEIDNFNNLQNKIKLQLVQQDSNANQMIKTIVDRRTSLLGNVDTDSLLKDYLSGQTIDNVVSSSDFALTALSFFKNYYANSKIANPQFLSYINRIPIAKLTQIPDAVTLVNCFYMWHKLDELKAQLLAKPQTFELQTAVSLINSKLATIAMKIGVSGHNLISKDPFGRILGNVGSFAVEGIDQLQGLMKTNESIRDLISKDSIQRGN